MLEVSTRKRTGVAREAAAQGTDAKGPPRKGRPFRSVRGSTRPKISHLADDIVLFLDAGW